MRDAAATTRGVSFTERVWPRRSVIRLLATTVVPRRSVSVPRQRERFAQLTFTTTDPGAVVGRRRGDRRRRGRYRFRRTFRLARADFAFFWAARARRAFRKGAPSPALASTRALRACRVVEDAFVSPEPV